MRAKSSLGTEFAAHVPVRGFTQWLQAGWIGTAYRLAHLRVSRTVVFLSASTLFYLV